MRNKNETSTLNSHVFFNPLEKYTGTKSHRYAALHVLISAPVVSDSHNFDSESADYASPKPRGRALDGDQKSRAAHRISIKIELSSTCHPP